jgi:hypothetical protein
VRSTLTQAWWQRQALLGADPAVLMMLGVPVAFLGA